MSLRALGKTLLQNGRILFRHFRTTYYKEIIVDEAKLNISPVGVNRSIDSGQSLFNSVRNVIHDQARKLLISNVLNRVTQPWSADLRRRATQRLFYGDSRPFFALVGVGLASGTGFLTKDDEIGGVCWEIREAVSKIQWSIAKEEAEANIRTDVEETGSLDQLELGQPIAKGCNAVVYAAKLKQDQAVCDTEDSEKEDCKNYPLAVKMMFNYDAESNAMSILRAMYRETVPARNYFYNHDVTYWEKSLRENKRTLPPHDNIVKMYSVFTDRVPELPGSHMYSDALPPRINPQGYGRNMSLFLLMKRYDCSLRQYIDEKQPSIRTGILLLAQLLEAINHMNVNGIAHRDLKTDNILVDLSEGDEPCPLLVVADFGCCLADKEHGLVLPYRSMDTDKGGNVALMAPEVVCARPGVFTSITYTKSDLWAAGTVAHELLGSGNPFYSGSRRAAALQSVSYEDEDVPDLNPDVPLIVQALVRAMLQRSPSNRPSCELAATILQVYLWAPSSWLRKDNQQLANSNEILQWLLCLTTKVLCESRVFKTLGVDGSPAHHMKGGRRTLPEYELIANFLRRVKLNQIKRALQWIHNVIDLP